MKKVLSLVLIVISLFALWYYLLFEGFKAETVVTDSILTSVSLSNSRYKYLTFDIIKFTREDGQVYYVNADKIVMIKPADLFEQEDAKKDAKD